MCGGEKRSQRRRLVGCEIYNLESQDRFQRILKLHMVPRPNLAIEECVFVLGKIQSQDRVMVLIHK